MIRQDLLMNHYIAKLFSDVKTYPKQFIFYE